MNDSNMGSSPNIFVGWDFYPTTGQRNSVGYTGYTIGRWKVPPEEKKGQLLIDMNWPVVLHQLVKEWQAAETRLTALIGAEEALGRG